MSVFGPFGMFGDEEAVSGAVPPPEAPGQSETDPAGSGAQRPLQGEHGASPSEAGMPVPGAESGPGGDEAPGVMRGEGAGGSGPENGSEAAHVVYEQWDAHGGDVVWRTCSCGERWTYDQETCPEVAW